mmetsp:Transcript_21072/g.31813  ORF Transcript_21072/g.31813 Transcript_21072/m.31813 type:complete len:244 (-) Transcript_21072:489-1220(-)
MVANGKKNQLKQGCVMNKFYHLLKANLGTNGRSTRKSPTLLGTITSATRIYKEKKQPKCKKAKFARFIQPITLVKTVHKLNETGAPEKWYEKVHVSFQSTSSCNIQGVNSINSNCLFTTQKSCGRGENKRSWLIEQNMARYLYLKTYGEIDIYDLQLKKFHIGYMSQKYWHSAMHHCHAMSITTAYDIYLELATEPQAMEAFNINQGKNRFVVLDFYSFRAKLASQGLKYDPTKMKYPGDKSL